VIRPESDKNKKIFTPRDTLLAELDSVEAESKKTLGDLSQDEFIWEPLELEKRKSDISLPPEKKRVWRVFETDGKWMCDYAPGNLEPAPFITIHWIMNHVAIVGIMYLQCIKTGKPEGVNLKWDDLPIFSNLDQMRSYVYEMLRENRDYLFSVDERDITDFLNSLTPAPDGETRPTWLNIWGGVILHTLQHMGQVAVIKKYIRSGLAKG
jgi:hypothetical protein